MSIKLKAVQKSEPGVQGGGNKGYTAVVTDSKLIRSREFMEEVASNYHISTVDIIRVLNSVAEEADRQLSRGNSVELFNLGILSLSVRSRMKNSYSELRKAPVTKTNINFRPASWLKEKVSRYKFKILSE